MESYTETPQITSPAARNGALPSDLADGDRAYLTALRDQLRSESPELRQAHSHYTLFDALSPADRALSWANDYLLLIATRDDDAETGAHTIHVPCPNCGGDLAATFSRDPNAALHGCCEAGCGVSGWHDALWQRHAAIYRDLKRRGISATSDECRPVADALLGDLLAPHYRADQQAAAGHSLNGSAPHLNGHGPQPSSDVLERMETRAQQFQTDQPTILPAQPTRQQRRADERRAAKDAKADGGKQGERSPHTRDEPCAVCGGWDDRKLGDERCWGFTVAEKNLCFCTNADYAGELEDTHGATDAYLHVIEGNCRCGERHDGEEWAQSRGPGKGTIVATYDYRDQRGQLLYQVVRLEPKRFYQRHPDPDNEGGWINNLKGITRTLYRLPELLQAPHSATIFIVEGEKDANRLRSPLGLHATTNAQGAEKWEDRFSAYLIDRPVVILPDNDEKGRKHAANVARSLIPFASSVKVVELPNLPEKGDVSDWLDAGGTRDELLKIVADAPVWTIADSIERRIIDAEALRRLRRDGSWLIKKTLRPRTLTLLAADYATYKSFMALDWAMSVASGRDWAGRTVAERGNVLYVVAEGADDIALRQRAWEQHHGTKVDGIKFLLAPVQFLDKNDVGALADEIAVLEGECGTFAMIVVDTVQRSMVGGNENDTGDMGRFVESCDSLKRRFDCTVLAVHHFNKGGTMRGSIVLPASCDVIYLMERKGETVTLTCEKMKAAKERDPLTFRAEVVAFDTAQDDQYAAFSDEDDDEDRTSVVLELVEEGADAGGELTPLLMTKEEKAYNIAYSLLSLAPDGMTNKEWETACVHHVVNAAAVRKGKSTGKGTKAKGNMSRRDFLAVKKSLIANGEIAEVGMKDRSPIYRVVVKAADAA